MFLTKTAKSQFVSKKTATSVRRRGAATAGCLQKINQFLEVDPIADIQEGVGPVEVHMLPACRVRSLDCVGPLVILLALGALVLPFRVFSKGVNSV